MTRAAKVLAARDGYVFRLEDPNYSGFHKH